MKILLTGILPHSVFTIASRLLHGGDQVAVLGHVDTDEEAPEGVLHHRMHPGHPDALRLMEAASYEAVVFFFAYQCEEAREYGSVQGAMLDALFAMLSKSDSCGVKRFALVTDQRVFGTGQKPLESETPMPDTPTGVLIKAAEDCLFCGVPDGVHPLLVRVSSLYDRNDPHSFFSTAVNCAKNNIVFRLTGAPDTPCDFLHADDLGEFLSLALGAGMQGVAHVSYFRPRVYSEVVRLLSIWLPGLRVSYATTQTRRYALEPGQARSVDWVPRHDFERELEELCEPEMPRVEKKKTKATTPFGKAMRVLAPWLELVLLGAVAIHLTRVAEYNTIFSVMDYMLLYVAVMGTVHGRGMGMAAAVVACGHYAYNWASAGNGLYLLLYNPDHWLPLCCYLLCGTMFGYLRDRQYERVETLRRERADLRAQNDFLQTIYHQAYEDRNQLQEQVMRSRDSYGRIYRITRELDTLQPEQVFLSTLDVLEDTMQNNSVAIYECKPDSPFARLVVNSRSMKNLARSLDMEKLDKMLKRLTDGKLFSNTALLAGYPAYAAPVMHDGALKAILMLWDVPFDKQTLYYENLFSVVAGLVQSSLIRSLRHLSMSADLYLENTHILSAAAFRSALGVYQSIHKRRMGQSLLVRITSDASLTVEQYDERISHAVRSSDLVGRLEDGCYYVLFPQATAENLPRIAARFMAQELKCEVVSQEVAYAE